MEENIRKTEEHLSKVSLEDQNKGIRTAIITDTSTR
jgi:hypothetical protein